MRSIVTPAEEALPILSQIATSRLNNSRAVALRGNSKGYWNFVRFYSVIGLIDTPFVSLLHDLSISEVESNTMSFCDILSRVSSIKEDSALTVTRLNNIPYPNELGSAATQEIIRAEGEVGFSPSPKP